MGKLPRVALEECVERADHHLRVSCARQPPSRVAEDPVLLPELPLSKLLAQQTYQRPQPLERLTRLVDRLLLRRVPLIGKQLDCEVELAERHSP